MRAITITIILAISTLSHAQTFEWLNTYQNFSNMNANGFGYPVAVDDNGNCYMAGYKNTPFLYSETFGVVGYSKIDETGATIYSHDIGGQAAVYKIVADHNNNLLMAAAYVETITIGDLTLSTVEQGVHHLLLKFDADGNLIWHQQLEMEVGEVSTFRAVTIDASNNIYIGYDNYMDSRIVKLSPDGVPLLTIEQQRVKSVSSVSVDDSGNIYAAGSCAEINANYAGVDVPADTLYNIYAAKYSPTGVFQYVRYIEDITCPLPIIIAKSEDAVYFSSQLFEDYSFGTVVSEGPTMGFGDFFISKLDAEGEFQWVREVPGAGDATPGNRNFLQLDATGNIYFAGSTRWNVNWGNGLQTTSQGFGEDALLLKYNPDGEILMAVTAGGMSYDRFDGVAVSGGSIYLTGVGYEDATFGTITHDAPDDHFYPFLTKLTDDSLGNPIFHNNSTLFWPNPVSTYLHVNADNTISGVIYNMLGQEVGDFQANISMPIDVSTLPKGTYIIKSSEGQSKFIKN